MRALCNVHAAGTKRLFVRHVWGEAVSIECQTALFWFSFELRRHNKYIAGWTVYFCFCASTSIDIDSFHFTCSIDRSVRNSFSLLYFFVPALSPCFFQLLVSLENIFIFAETELNFVQILHDRTPPNPFAPARSPALQSIEIFFALFSFVHPFSLCFVRHTEYSNEGEDNIFSINSGCKCLPMEHFHLFSIFCSLTPSLSLHFSHWWSLFHTTYIDKCTLFKCGNRRINSVVA